MTSNKKFWIVFLVIIFFFLGGVTGIFISNNFLDNGKKQNTKKRNKVRFPTLEVMAKELSLSEEQKGLVYKIFEESDEKLKTLGKQIHQQYSFNRANLINNIKKVLNESQKTKLESMIQRYLEERKKQREKRERRNDERKIKNIEGQKNE